MGLKRSKERARPASPGGLRESVAVRPPSLAGKHEPGPLPMSLAYPAHWALPEIGGVRLRLRHVPEPIRHFSQGVDGGISDRGAAVKYPKRTSARPLHLLLLHLLVAPLLDGGDQDRELLAKAFTPHQRLDWRPAARLLL
ncbi:hypothetical protein T492DRAFT_409606 [Pavlovales sp. CCMP2436]|nr:hypothetical protein T492DRAFT_409606 [Pavlovales sp. CCMP2436]